jgi:ATP-dependent Lon protease
MACALYSLVTGQPPADAVAMTGELTLSGLVMPIGGVKEKVIASRRANVKTLILPLENQSDYEDLDPQIREGITPHFVRTFEEVQRICFPNASAPRKRKRGVRSGGSATRA